MNKLFLGLFLVLGVAACTSPTEVSDLAKLQALDFTATKSIAVARVQGRSAEANAFRGYRLISSWRSPDEKTGAELSAVLLELIREDLAIESQPSSARGGPIRLLPFCVFNPGYAVRLKTDRGWRDFLLCFQCDEVVVYDEQGHSWEQSFDPPIAAKMTDLLRGF